jgi:hypothetical protein
MATIFKNKTTKTQETEVNNILVGGAKKPRAKKKSIADDFESIGVTTTTAKQEVQTGKQAVVTAKQEVKTTSKKSQSKEEENTYSKNGYVRPAVTMTDQLSKEQIEEKLEDYVKVDDIYKVPLGVHMRYFSNVNGKMVFRMGGLLHKNTGLPEYVILSTTPTGKPGWSVQVKDTIFYRKMTLNEIKTEYQSIIDDLIEKNKKLKDENKKLAKYVK